MKYVLNPLVLGEYTDSEVIVLFHRAKDGTYVLNKSAAAFYSNCLELGNRAINETELISQYIDRFRKSNVPIERLECDAKALMVMFVHQGILQPDCED